MIAFAEDVSGITVSFEFFPPKGDGDESFWQTIRKLETVNPSFVSVTYGAGGTTRTRTHETVSRLAQETSLTPAAHLTCVGATREEVDEVARSYLAAGVLSLIHI